MPWVIIGDGCPFRTEEDAQAFIDERGGSFRVAAKRLHPDAGGSPEMFKQLVAARRVLDGEWPAEWRAELL